MSTASRAPWFGTTIAPGLRDVVHGYFDAGVPRSARTFHVVPDGCVDLLFTLSDPAAPIPGSEGASEAAVVGVVTHAFEVTVPAGADLFGVTLSPHAAHALLGVPLVELRDRLVDLVALWGAEARVVRERLRDAADGPARACYLGALIQKKLSAGPSPDAAVGAALGMIGESGGRLSMGDLSERLGLSTRSLERLFARHTGVSPKLFSRVARVQAAIVQLSRATTPRSWSRLAGELGFADQAHMIREFRAITGLTPTRYAAPIGVSHSFNTTLGDRASVVE
jgi:AraC-like DNA-binding protein